VTSADEASDPTTFAFVPRTGSSLTYPAAALLVIPLRDFLGDVGVPVFPCLISPVNNSDLSLVKYCVRFFLAVSNRVCSVLASAVFVKILRVTGPLRLPRSLPLQSFSCVL